jgi:[methyl-Co(III) methanol-specific corrinoid protein]:coenzyme M methyltransferase
MVNLASLKDEFPGLRVMGNISTYTLEWGPTEKIRQLTSRLVEQKIDIIAPACGLSTATSLENIRALTSVVKGENA